MWANRFIGVFQWGKFKSQFAVFSRQTAVFLAIFWSGFCRTGDCVISGLDLNNLGHLLLVDHTVAIHVVHSGEEEIGQVLQFMILINHNFLFGQLGGEGGRYWKRPSCDLRPFYLFPPPTTSFKGSHHLFQSKVSASFSTG